MKAVTDGSETACLSRCEQDPLCMVAEYDSNDGSCWVHMEGSAGICGTFYDNPGVFHYEKIPCGMYIILNCMAVSYKRQNTENRESTEQKTTRIPVPQS